MGDVAAKDAIGFETPVGSERICLDNIPRILYGRLAGEFVNHLCDFVILLHVTVGHLDPQQPSDTPRSGADLDDLPVIIGKILMRTSATLRLAVPGYVLPHPVLPREALSGQDL